MLNECRLNDDFKFVKKNHELSTKSVLMIHGDKRRPREFRNYEICDVRNDLRLFTI